MNNRIIGLDLLRSIIMLFGPTFHTSMLIAGAFGFRGMVVQSEITHDILNYTHPFRMSLFFLISGFFAALLISKKSSQYYIQNRIQRLIRPTIFSLVTILPITILFIVYLQGFTQLSYHISLRHLWFLVLLSVISAITFFNPQFFVEKAQKCALKLSRFNYIGIFFIIYFVVCAIRLIADWLSNIFLVSYLQIPSVVGYCLSFFIGMILFFIEKRPSFFTIISAIIFFTVWYVLSRIDDYVFILGAWSDSVQLFFTLMMCISLFNFFRFLNIKGNKLITEMSRIALPFYIVHLPILILVSNVWLDVSENRSGSLLAIVAVSMNILLSYLVAKFMLKFEFFRRNLGVK